MNLSLKRQQKTRHTHWQACLFQTSVDMMLSKVSLAFLGIVVLLFRVRGAKDDVVCELAAFMRNLDGSDVVLIDSGPVPILEEEEPLRSCTEDGQICKRLVEKRAEEGTKGGNLSLSVDDREGYTVGDVLCDKADHVQEDVKHKIVHIYWRLCRSQWMPTDFSMKEALCCEDGLYVPCGLIKTEL